jgi:hypothetical protein
VLNENDARPIRELLTFRFDLLHCVRALDRIACAEEDVVARDLRQLQSGEISQTLVGAGDEHDLRSRHDQE